MTETIAELFVARADDPRPGIVSDDETWSWAEVVDASLERAAVLEELGVAGGHVGVLLENVPEYVFLLGAAALGGSVVVGINPTRRGAELARDIRHTECRLVLTESSQRHLLDGLDVGVPVMVVDDAEWQERVAARRGASLPATTPGPDALYVLIFTSGSTGAPKAVRMSQGRAARTMAGSAAAYGPDDVLYCAMPLFHGNALLANLFPGLAAGATVVLKRRFSASTFMADVRRHGVTSFNYVGRALSYVLAQPPSPDDADNRLRFCVGSEASPRDRREFRRRFGCYVVEGYSSSEGAVVIQPFPGMPREALGRPAEGTDVVVVDPETMAECPRARFGPDGELLNATQAIGEIVRRDGLASFEGYHANESADRERGRNGWYWTGDLAYRDHDGTFYFAGRTSDWIRVDGENFAAGPIEAIVGRFEGVASVVVFGVPDPVAGDQVMAVLELDAGAGFDVDAFSEFIDDQPDLGTKSAPRFVRVVDAIPLTATGKVDRKPLRAQRWDAGGGVWWRPPGAEGYRALTADDVAGLRRAFDEAGRGSVLDAGDAQPRTDVE